MRQKKVKKTVLGKIKGTHGEVQKLYVEEVAL